MNLTYEYFNELGVAVVALLVTVNFFAAVHHPADGKAKAARFVVNHAAIVLTIN